MSNILFTWEPTQYKRGKVRQIVRSAERQTEALAGHRRDAHGGKRDPHCRACQEMEAKLKKAVKCG
jgi:hypothetical protein